MTARRSSGSASAASAAFGRAFPAAQARPAAAPPGVPEPHVEASESVAPARAARGAQKAVESPPKTKYTLLLDAEESVALDQLVLSARRQLDGRRVEKSTLLRTLVTLAADDATLLAQVVEEIRSRGRA